MMTNLGCDVHIPVISETYTPALKGRSKFLLYNAAGGIVWATLAGLTGYMAGNLLHSFGQLDQVEGTLAWITVGTLAMLALGWILWRRWRKKGRIQEEQTVVEQTVVECEVAQTEPEKQESKV